MTKQLKSISTAVKFASRIVNIGTFSNQQIRLPTPGIGVKACHIGKPTIKPSRSRRQLQPRRSVQTTTDSVCGNRFRPPGTAIVGKFPYHCHILEHEDGGMMGNLRVTLRPDRSPLAPSVLCAAKA